MIFFLFLHNFVRTQFVRHFKVYTTAKLSLKISKNNRKNIYKIKTYKKPQSTREREPTMTKSPTPMAGKEETDNWQNDQSDDVEMKDPGSVTGKRSRNDLLPEEERNRDVTRAIKQELIDEASGPKESTTTKQQNDIIDLTNTDGEEEDNEEERITEESEDSSEESSEDLYGD